MCFILLRGKDFLARRLVLSKEIQDLRTGQVRMATETMKVRYQIKLAPSQWSLAPWKSFLDAANFIEKGLSQAHISFFL